MISIQEFKKVIRDQRIDISETECHQVFEVFDQWSTGLINYMELLACVKGVVDESRRRLISRVW
jgi:Ca2+-binding EF-hand superfamily protein